VSRKRIFAWYLPEVVSACIKHHASYPTRKQVLQAVQGLGYVDVRQREVNLWIRHLLRMQHVILDRGQLVWVLVDSPELERLMRESPRIRSRRKRK